MGLRDLSFIEIQASSFDGNMKLEKTVVFIDSKAKETISENQGTRDETVQSFVSDRFVT